MLPLSHSGDGLIACCCCLDFSLARLLTDYALVRVFVYPNCLALCHAKEMSLVTLPTESARSPMVLIDNEMEQTKQKSVGLMKKYPN